MGFCKGHSVLKEPSKSVVFASESAGESRWFKMGEAGERAARQAAGRCGVLAVGVP